MKEPERGGARKPTSVWSNITILSKRSPWGLGSFQVLSKHGVNEQGCSETAAAELRGEPIAEIKLNDDDAKVGLQQEEGDHRYLDVARHHLNTKLNANTKLDDCYDEKVGLQREEGDHWYLESARHHLGTELNANAKLNDYYAEKVARQTKEGDHRYLKHIARHHRSEEGARRTLVGHSWAVSETFVEDLRGVRAVFARRSQGAGTCVAFATSSHGDQGALEEHLQALARRSQGARRSRRRSQGVRGTSSER